MSHRHFPDISVTTSGGNSSVVSTERLYEIINILGKRDLRMLLPLFESDPVDGEQVQDISQRGNHFQAMNNVAFDNDPYVRGELLSYPLNGVNEAIDMADDPQFSFGDGLTDKPFSLVLAVKFNDVTQSTLISRQDETNAAEQREFFMETEASDLFRLLIYDNSEVNAYIGRRYAGASLVEGVWYVLIGTYDGTGVSSGIKLFVNGIRVDDANQSAGAYTAMENTSVVTAIGYRTGVGGALERFLDGDCALPAITARKLSDGGVAKGQPAHRLSDVARLTALYREVLELN